MISIEMQQVIRSLRKRCPALRHTPLPRVLLVLALLVCAPLLAKRAEPAPVAPVVHNNVRYEAPNTDGTSGIVVATSVATGRELWRSAAYKVSINPGLETDVQWVFIRSLSVDSPYLDVTDELGGKHQISLTTGEPGSLDRITMMDKPPEATKAKLPPWLRITTWVLGGVLALCVAVLLQRGLGSRRRTAGHL